MFFSSILSLLNEIPLTSFTQGADLNQHLDEATCERWKRLETFLHKVYVFICPYSWFLWGAKVENFIPWPRVYDYTESWQSQDIVQKHLQTVRAVFAVKMAQLSYMHFTSERTLGGELKWLALAARNRLTMWKVNNFRSSSICSNVVNEGLFERAGLIINAN